MVDVDVVKAQRRQLAKLKSQLRNRQISRSEFTRLRKEKGLLKITGRAKPSVKAQVLGKEFEKQRLEQMVTPTPVMDPVAVARAQAREALRPIGAPTTAEKVAERVAIKKTFPIVTRGLTPARDISVRVERRVIRPATPVKETDITPEFESKIRKLQKFETTTQRRKQEFFELTRLKDDPTQPRLVRELKFAARLPIEIGFGLVRTGMRIPFVVRSLQFKAGREEAVRAAKETPGAVIRGFDPRKVGGIQKIALTAFAIRAKAQQVAPRFRSTKIEFTKGGIKTGGDITLVGKGKLFGKKVEAVISTKGKISRATFRTKPLIGKGEVFKVTQTPRVTTVRTFKGTRLLSTKIQPTTPSNLLLVRPQKPALLARTIKAQAIQGPSQRFVIQEAFRTKVAGATRFARAKIIRGDIITRRADISAQITKATLITPKGGQIKQFVLRQPDVVFGKVKPTPDILTTQQVKGGTLLTQVRQPRVFEIGVRKTTGVVQLTIDQPSPFTQVLRGLARSRKGTLAAAATRFRTEVKPTVTIPPTASVFVKGSRIPVVDVRTFTTPGAAVVPFSVVGQRPILSQREEQTLLFSQRLRQRQALRPSIRPVESQLTVPRQLITGIPRIRQRGRQTVTVGTGPAITARQVQVVAPSLGIDIGFGRPVITGPAPPPPPTRVPGGLGFDLPRFGAKPRKGEAFDPFAQEFQVRPTFLQQAFQLPFTPKAPTTRFTGFELTR